MFSKLVGKIYQSLMQQFLGTGIYRFRIIKLIHDYMLTLLPTENFETNDFKMVSESGNLFLTQISNKFEISFCKEKIQKNMTVLDIGANVGYYTVNFASIVGEKGQVFAFEPDPSNFSILKKNIRLNNFKNIILVNKAVSNSLSPTTLFQNSSNTGGHSIIKTENSKKKILVDSTTLDEYFKNFSHPIDLIKIDVEGAEYQVISGGLNFFKKLKPKYLITEFELNSVDLSHVDSFYPDLLSDLGYVLLGKTDNSKGNSCLLPTSITELKVPYEKKEVVNLIWKLS